jgi:two-component system, NarL family, invasion response regulator UvrY
MISVLIADDHVLVRDGLKRILTETEDIVVAGEASTGQEVLEKTRQNSYDVILLDISMPDKSGIDILSDLKRDKRRVLILTMHPEEQYAIRALKSGAYGYITKQSAAEQLIAAIHSVSNGKRYITPALAEALALSLGEDGDKAPHELLSPREYQVFMMVARGNSIKEIAKQLFLSVKTVSTYRSRILQKMEMTNFFELIHYAIRHNLTE